MRGARRVLGGTWPLLIDAPPARREPLLAEGRGQDPEGERSVRSLRKRIQVGDVKVVCQCGYSCVICGKRDRRFAVAVRQSGNWSFQEFVDPAGWY